jgi:multidrug efflux system membrane fusion protein
MLKHMNVRALVFGVSLLLLWGCSQAAEQQAAAGAMALPPVPVSTATAVEETVPVQVRAVGNVEAYASVGVKAQVSGPLVSVHFTEGANVQKGDLLFEIDSRPFREVMRQAEATVRKAEAELRVAEANLARDRAQLKNAQVEASRFEQLSKEGISTRMQEEQIRTAAEVAAQSVRADEAAIESIRAALEAGQSAVEQARLNVGYAEIRAPISGRTGNLLLHPGNLVQANAETPLVVINQIAPIFVSFGVPERYLSEIMTRQRAKRQLSLEVFPEEGAGTASRGTLAVIDNTVDAATGTLRLKGLLDNRDGRLWPGQFVSVVLTLDTRKATVIPAEAVQSGQQGPFVYVVKGDETVEPRPVTVGQTVSGKVIIEGGVAAGEVVVTDGQSRLYPGAKVAPATPAAASSGN